VPAVSIAALKPKTFLSAVPDNSFDMNQTQLSHSGANIQIKRSEREFALGLVAAKPWLKWEGPC